MTDDSATLRALDDIALLTRWGASRAAVRPLDGFEILALKIAVSQSSWAKEKAELERQLAQADDLLGFYRGDNGLRDKAQQAAIDAYKMRRS